MKNAKTKKIEKSNVFFTVILVVLVLYTALMFGLFLMGINISLKQYLDVEVGSNIFGLPDMKYWKIDRDYPNNIFGNYLYAFENIKLDKNNSYIVGLFNKERVNAPIQGDIISCSLYTILYAGGCAFFATFVPMFMGYLCAMYPNKVASFLYALVVFVIATPIVGSQPSTINLMRSLRLYDTFYGEFLRKATFTNMYFLIFFAYFKGMSAGYSEAAEIDGASQLSVMFRIYIPLASSIFFTVFLIFFAYFKGMSAGYSEAAEIDGASQLSVMFRIYIPLASSIFFTVFLILFVNYWNDFTTPMMFLPSKPTLSYAIYYTTSLDSGSSFNHATRRMAALMVFAIPIIIIFTVFNKRLMTNLTMGGMKE